MNQCVCVCVWQRWALSAESLSAQGAGDESQHFGARSQLSGRGDEQTDGLSGHPSDSCGQPQRQPQGQIPALQRMWHHTGADFTVFCVYVLKISVMVCFHAAGSDSERAGHPGAEEREGDSGLDHWEAGEQTGGHERPLQWLEGRHRGAGEKTGTRERKR